MQSSPDTEEKRAIIDTADLLDKIKDLMRELSTSTKELSASSKRLEFLTDILIFLTFFLALLEITDLYLNHPSDEIVKFIYFLFIVALIAAFSNRIFGLLRKRWNRGFSKDL